MAKFLEDELNRFYLEGQYNSKGKLSVVLVITEQAAKRDFPLDTSSFVTEGGGQVYGLGRDAVQKILKRHNIDQILAKEGGRTSRGSLGNMRDYVNFLNSLYEEGIYDPIAIELFWVGKVKLFFSAKPLKVKSDYSHSLRSLIRDVISQAEERQKESQGVHYAGAVMQHLVGAKLDCALGKDNFQHNSFSTSDAQTGRNGDFFIGNVALHITTTPTEAVIGRCRENLERGQRPVLITTKKGLPVAEGLADNAGIAYRIDIFEIEQFIALNLYEFSKFEEAARSLAVKDLIVRYNEIVETYETDPSLLIELQQ
jgi:hypothetical protein